MYREIDRMRDIFIAYLVIICGVIQFNLHVAVSKINELDKNTSEITEIQQDFIRELVTSVVLIEENLKFLNEDSLLQDEINAQFIIKIQKLEN